MHNLRPYINSLGLPESNQLTERDAAMLIIAAGRQAGFKVRTEVLVYGLRPSGNPGRGEIDVGWYGPDEGDPLIVAWEVDGRDAPNSHFTGVLTHRQDGSIKKDTMGNKAKFQGIDCVRKIQVLYSLKNDLRQKRAFNPEIPALLPVGVAIFHDVDLVAHEGIETLVLELQDLL